MKILLLASLAGLSLLVPAPIYSQSANGAANLVGASSAADLDWGNLQDVVNRTNSTTVTTSTPGQKQTSDLLAAADQCKAYYSLHPTSANAKNAKCLEGILLERAWLAGDMTQKSRRDQIAMALRHDKSITPALRAELFAFSDSVAIEKGPALTRDQKLSAYEQATRALIAEFPDLPIGYESLCAIAHDSSDAKALAIAKEVAGMEAAPIWVKTQAQIVADRFALIGQSLPALVSSIVAKDSPLSAPVGHPLFVYTWSSTDTASILRAKAIAAKATKGAVFVGICFDSDTASAKAVADSLPGLQIFESLGAKGTLAQKLKLTEAGLIYFSDVAGIVRSVSVQNYIDSAVLPFAG